jgi:hypothetical protein
MNATRVVGWIVAVSKQEAVYALEMMLEKAKQCDEDDNAINISVRKDDSV